MDSAKIVAASDAVKIIKSNSKIMCGGFLVCGAPINLIDALVTTNVSNLHLIAIATDYADRGIGKLVTNKQIKSAQVSHIGTNTSSQEQFNNGSLKIEFNPQGTLTERVRAAGYGLGGFLSRVGIGTDLEQDDWRKVIELDGERFFVESPIKADVALIRAKTADTMGNLVYSKTARNINPMMAMSATVTIVEVDEIVEVGQINPEHIVTPGICIDYIVKHI